MKKVGILGASGRMGRALLETLSASPEVVLAFAAIRDNSPLIGTDAGLLVGQKANGILLSALSDVAFEDVDVVIDFTLPDALANTLQKAKAAKIPLVIGTTGLNDKQLASIDEAAKSIPIVFSANYSIGVNLLFALARQATRVMHKHSDIEIMEAHHRFKRDAPSGTALAIGEHIADELGVNLSERAVYARQGDTGEREAGSIGFATIRAGDIVGEHTVLFASMAERLELSHKASSRLTFAQGAVSAASWITARPVGLYSMQNVLAI